MVITSINPGRNHEGTLSPSSVTALAVVLAAPAIFAAPV